MAPTGTRFRDGLQARAAIRTETRVVTAGRAPASCRGMSIAPMVAANPIAAARTYRCLIPLNVGREGRKLEV
jgi:hypothetical protein